MQIAKGAFEKYSLFFTMISATFLFVVIATYFYLKKNKKLDKKI